MRDLFRFLYRARNTLLFLALLIGSLYVLSNESVHHQNRAISSSNAIAGTIFSWRKEITDYANLKEVNRRLAQENVDWRNRHKSSYSPVESKFVRINDSIHMQEYAYIPAKVVNSTWHRSRNFLTLDKGSRDGVHDNMGVIGPDGIVGVVRDVSPHFSSVISVLSPEIKNSVRLRRTGHFGLLYWDRDEHGPTTASVIDIAKHARVNIGDTVETRGGEGIFPEGVMVGIVEEVSDQPGSNYHNIRIRLAEDMTRSGFVYIVKDLKRMERDSLEQAHRVP